MTFGNHDFLLLSHQHQQALTRHAVEFRRVRRDPDRRDPAWTAYACETAAAFAHAFLRARPIEPLARP